MDRLVSVIVPAYNAEATLEKCIESLLEQSYQPLEIIIIDDGSNDGTKNIGEHYQEKNENVVFYSQENQGVSAARNKGIELSQGEWIAFADSDDYALPSYIQGLVDCQKKYDADWVVGGSVVIQGNRKETRKYPYRQELVTSGNMEKYLETWYLNSYFPSPWGKLYSSQLIKENKINFPIAISNGEDATFNINYIGVCQRIGMLYDASYVYVHREGSLTGRWKDPWKDQEIIYGAFYGLCEAKGYASKAADRFFVRSILLALNFATYERWNMKQWMELCQQIQKSGYTSKLNLKELGLDLFFTTVVKLLRGRNFRLVRLLFQLKIFAAENMGGIYQKLVNREEKRLLTHQARGKG